MLIYLVMSRCRASAGKAIHFWAAQDPLPFGPPKLIVTMCTPDTQAKYHEPSVWSHKDKSSGTSSQQLAESRKDLDYHERLPGADQWERGGELYEFVSEQRTPNRSPQRMPVSHRPSHDSSIVR